MDRDTFCDRPWQGFKNAIKIIWPVYCEQSRIGSELAGRSFRRNQLRRLHGKFIYKYPIKKTFENLSLREELFNVYPIAADITEIMQICRAFQGIMSL